MAGTTLHVIQAKDGDCLLLEDKIGGLNTTILIDGGQSSSFKKYAEPVLDSIGKRLDLVILSHLCQDHVAGLSDLFDIPGIQVAKTWINIPGSRNKSAGQGQKVKIKAAKISIVNRDSKETVGFPVIAEFGKGPLVFIDENVHLLSKTIGSVKIDIFGPTKELMRQLKQDIDTKKITEPDNRSSNLSSITFLATTGSGKRLLFSGMRGSDHVLAHMRAAGLLDGDGKIVVDVLKVPHHGSNANVLPGFFEKVIANTYVIPGDGVENPDSTTLTALRTQTGDRAFTVVFTNKGAAVDAFVAATRGRVTCLIASQDQPETQVIDIHP